MMLRLKGDKVDHPSLRYWVGNDVLWRKILSVLTVNEQIPDHTYAIPSQILSLIVVLSVKIQSIDRHYKRTWVGCLNTRWSGFRDLNRSAGMSARYAFVPLHEGSIKAVISAASDHLFCDWAHWIFSPKSERLTADFSPSAPRRTSQEIRVPSSKRRLMGPPIRWVYDRRRLLQWIL